MRMQLSIADLCAVDVTGGPKGISRSSRGMLHVFFKSDIHLHVHSFHGLNIASSPPLPRLGGRGSFKICTLHRFT